MSKAKQYLVFVGVAALAAAIGFAFQILTQDEVETPGIPPAEAAAPALMSARLPDLDSKPQAIEQWRGKVLVVNFWATWCGPCREEIPEFIKAQERLGPKGLQIVGIAIDQPDKVRPYSADMKINYPILVGDSDGIELARRAGNRLGGLPFTVVLDRNGKAVQSHLGPLNRQKLEAIVLPLL